MKQPLAAKPSFDDQRTYISKLEVDLDRKNKNKKQYFSNNVATPFSDKFREKNLMEIRLLQTPQSNLPNLMYETGLRYSDKIES